MPNCKMTTRKHILTFILASLSLFIFGQTDTTKRKYVYDICIYHKAKVKPTVLKNEIIGIGDTTVVFINETVYDNYKRPIGFAVINLVSLTDNSVHGVIADSLGDFRLTLLPDKYKMTALCVGYKTLTLDELNVRTGELRKLKIQLTRGDVFKSYSIPSDRPLNKLDLHKIKKQLRRKG